MSDSLGADYFRRLYSADADPWRISRGWYEQRKRALVLAALPRERFRTVFEPGCGNGDLTVLLAGRADRVVAWDPVDTAVDAARQRTAQLPSVEVRIGGLPGDWPTGPADLVVLSELGYYLDEADLVATVAAAAAHLEPGGTLLAVHWRHDAPDYPLTGDRVHEVIDAQPGLYGAATYRDADVALDVWTAGETPSVARAEGLLDGS